MRARRRLRGGDGRLDEEERGRERAGELGRDREIVFISENASSCSAHPVLCFGVNHLTRRTSRISLVKMSHKLQVRKKKSM